MPKRLDGRALAAKIYEKVQTECASLAKAGVTPCLATLRIGERGDQIAYERSLLKALVPRGIQVMEQQLDESASLEEVLHLLRDMAQNERVHGILLFAPLPEHLPLDVIAFEVPTDKDVDALNPLTLGRLFRGDRDCFAPSTAEAAMRMAQEAGIAFEGKEVVVLGRSLVVGKPLAVLAISNDATVTVAHSKTRHLSRVTRRAEILFVAVGRAGFVTADMVSPGAVVIDVGINVNEEGKLVGDVAYEEVKEIASLISPVPGGVGSVTTAVLAEQIVKAAQRALGIK